METVPIDNIKITSDENVLAKRAEALKDDDDKLMDVCKDFESIFVYTMFKKMRDTIPDGGLEEKSMGRTVFEDMYLEEVAKEASNQNNGIGIAKMMYDQFKRGDIKI